MKHPPTATVWLCLLGDILALLPELPRPLLEALADGIIDLLDTKDGDADLEPEDPAEEDEPEEHWVQPLCAASLRIAPSIPLDMQYRRGAER